LTLEEPAMAALDGRRALVTGASRGIGSGIALALARHGADVAVNFFRSPEQAEAVCEQIRALGRQACAVQADVASAEEVVRMAAEARQALGPIDILVNNAGHNLARPILEIDEAQWDWVLRLNLKAYFLCAKAVLPGMLEHGEGRIINIASISGQRGGLSGDVDYSAAKAGILGFTRALARWAAPQGVLVNAVAPGYIDTEPLRQNLSEERRAQRLEQIPLKRFGTPEDVGEVVAFLAGPGASYIVGEVISVNGGIHMT